VIRKYARPVRARPAIVEPALTARQIATLHGVTVRTVANWARDGHFSTYRRTPAGSVEVPVSVYQQFISANELHPGGRAV
jgi:hypothetical protein